MIIKNIFLLGVIFAFPFIAAASPTCSGTNSDNGNVTLSVGSYFNLSEPFNPTAQELYSMTCPNVTFDLGPGIQAKSFLTIDPSSAVSDVLTLRNTASGSSEILFTSDFTNPPGPCQVVSGWACGYSLETIPVIVGASLNGTPLEFTFTFTPSHFLGESADRVDLASVSQTPEPATFATFGTGVLAIAGFLRRKIVRLCRRI